MPRPAFLPRDPQGDPPKRPFFAWILWGAFQTAVLPQKRPRWGTLPVTKRCLWGAALFVLHGFYGAVKEGDSNSPCPRALRPAGQKRPGGAFLPRGTQSAGHGLFESSRSHQEQHLMGCCSFCFAWILWGGKRGGFEQPVPRALRPAGQKRPGGAFLPAGRKARGTGCSNPPGRTKSSTLWGAALFCFAWIFMGR